MQNTLPFSRRTILAGLGALPVLGSLALSAGAEALPPVTVAKDPSCGCCDGWVAHLEAAGFPVRVVESAHMQSVKDQLGVPADLASCHTAVVAGYVIEGHVPATAISRLLAGRPAGIGLAVPGMPAGSPGMEMPGVEPEAYDVFLFDGSGHRGFLRFRGAREI